MAEASAQEIDQLNILQATLLAMRRAVEGLRLTPHCVLVDGNRLPVLTMPAQAIVKGDAKVQAIAAASILAKVHRDRLCLELHERYPQYGFAAPQGLPHGRAPAGAASSMAPAPRTGAALRPCAPWTAKP